MMTTERHTYDASGRSMMRSSGDNGFSRLAVVSAALFQILTPVLPSLGVGRPIGERSDMVQTVITPAGWTFSIWGLLYAGSLAFAIYQALPAQREKRLLATLRWPCAGAFVGNGLWALYTQLVDLTVLSVLIIGLTLACLLFVFRQLAQQQSLTRGEQVLVALPLSALAAWLTAATIVNIAAALQYHAISLGLDEAIVGGGVILIGGIIASAALWRGQGNPWYALAFLWALAGIYGANGQIALLASACSISALFVVAVAAFELRRIEARILWFGHADATYKHSH